MNARGHYRNQGAFMAEKTHRDAAAPDPGEHDQRKRAAVKRLIAAGGVVAAAHWSRPVVDAVILPAHAQSTGFAPPAGFTGSGSITFTLV
jgi:hypothetical protein